MTIISDIMSIALQALGPNDTGLTVFLINADMATRLILITNGIFRYMITWLIRFITATPFESQV